MPDLSAWVSLQRRSRRNARGHLAVIRRERADAAAVQAWLDAAAGHADREEQGRG